MAVACEFYGPITVYVRREDGEFAALIDPFSIIGTGRTVDAAVAQARELLLDYFEAVTDEIRKHGVRKVRVLCPLDADERAGAVQVLQGCVHVHVRGQKAGLHPSQVKPKPLNRLARILTSATECDLSPLFPAAAGA